MSESTRTSDLAHQIGCAELPPGMSRAKYFEKLSLLEVAAFYTGTPSRKAVRTWREKSPESARFSVIAHKSLETCPTTEEGKKAAEHLVDACQILEAEAVVFKTPSTFSPSASNRDRMREFFGTIASADAFGKTARVWAPDGLWEATGITEMAEELDVLVALDPLAPDPLGENGSFVAEQMARGRAYLRIAGLGHGRNRYEGYQLEMLMDMVRELEASWTVFGHPGKYPDALAAARELRS